MFKRARAVLKDCRGVTLIELLVALGLLTMVMVAAFNFFGFAQRSWQIANSEAAVGSETQLLLMQVERDIRSVKRGSQGQPGVEIIGQGVGLRLFSYLDEAERIVEYRFLEDRNLLTRKVFIPAADPEEEPVLETETGYEDIYQSAGSVGLFSLDGNRVALKFKVEVSQDRYTKKIEVDTGFTIRNRGVEQDD